VSSQSQTSSCTVSSHQCSGVACQRLGQFKPMGVGVHIFGISKQVRASGLTPTMMCTAPLSACIVNVRSSRPPQRSFSKFLPSCRTKVTKRRVDGPDHILQSTGRDIGSTGKKQESIWHDPRRRDYLRLELVSLLVADLFDHVPKHDPDMQASAPTSPSQQQEQEQHQHQLFQDSPCAPARGIIADSSRSSFGSERTPPKGNVRGQRNSLLDPFVGSWGEATPSTVASSCSQEDEKELQQRQQQQQQQQQQQHLFLAASGTCSVSSTFRRDLPPSHVRPRSPAHLRSGAGALSGAPKHRSPLLHAGMQLARSGSQPILPAHTLGAQTPKYRSAIPSLASALGESKLQSVPVRSLSSPLIDSKLGSNSPSLSLSRSVLKHRARLEPSTKCF